ncbi:MAG: hypothetical protein IKA94_06415 [Mogibacterium sp.]|nr:hypothetical protein [Mogibacterium sp.]
MDHFRPKVHGLHDLLPAPLHSPVLEVFAHPVEQHNTHSLGVFADQKRADGGDGHEEVFIEHMAFGQVPQGSLHNIPAQQYIRSKADQQRQQAVSDRGQQQTADEQKCTDQQHPGTVFLSGMMPVTMIMMVFLMVMGMMFMVMTAAAFVVMVMMFMMVTAAALVIMFVMLMVMTAAALVVMVMMLVMVTEAALVVMVMMLVMVTAAALVVMVMMFMMVTAAAFVVMVMIVPVCFPGRASGISGIDLHPAFHRPGNLSQLRNQRIRVFRRQPQLFCGKRNDGLLHSLVIIEFLLDLRCTVGTVQIVNDIYFSGHPNPSCFYFNI